MTRSEILKTIKEHHAQLLAALEGIPEEAMRKRPVVEWWTIKDLLGHIAMWEHVAIQFIAEYKQTGVPQPLGIEKRRTGQRVQQTRRDDSPRLVARAHPRRIRRSASRFDRGNRIAERRGSIEAIARTLEARRHTGKTDRDQFVPTQPGAYRADQWGSKTVGQ
jgi:hypothetical protein